MTDAHDRLADEIRALREEFDQTFAQEPPKPAEAGVDHILVDAGAVYALAVSELRDVGRLPPVQSVPTRAHGMLGLCGIGRELVAVFDLATLLGEPPGDAPTWFARPVREVGGSARESHLAFAFGRLIGQRHARPELEEGRDPRLRGFLADAHAPARVPIVHLPHLLERLHQAATSPDPETP